MTRFQTVGLYDSTADLRLTLILNLNCHKALKKNTQQTAWRNISERLGSGFFFFLLLGVNVDLSSLCFTVCGSLWAQRLNSNYDFDFTTN